MRAKTRKAPAMPGASRRFDTLPLSAIRLDGGTQPRAEIDQLVVDEYCEALKAGVKLPPVDVFFDGETYWLADGFHRVAAHGLAELKKIVVDVLQGTREDAVWFSAGANRGHGLRRTNADKRRAVLTALHHPRGKSSRAVAEHVGVSPDFVARLRADLSSKDTSRATARVEGRDGKSYPAAKPSSTEKLLPEVRAVVRDSHLADDRKAIAALAKVEPEKQLEVAKRVVAGESLAAAQRSPHDFYATPFEAIAPLLPFIRKLPKGRWLEPCVGDGSIVRAIGRADVKWDLVDIRPEAGFLVQGLGGFEGRDYLTRPAPAKRYAVGLSNMPFDLGEEFIRKLLCECDIVVGLLPLNFAATNGRIAFHQDHPSNLYVLADRPSFTGDGHTDSNEVAWFTWGMGEGGRWSVLAPVPAAGAR